MPTISIEAQSKLTGEIDVRFEGNELIVDFSKMQPASKQFMETLRIDGVGPAGKVSELTVDDPTRELLELSKLWLIELFKDEGDVDAKRELQQLLKRIYALPAVEMEEVGIGCTCDAGQLATSAQHDRDCPLYFPF